jgi:hypothetical protein
MNEVKDDASKLRAALNRIKDLADSDYAVHGSLELLQDIASIAKVALRE